jgi:shikimate kinase
MSNKTHCLLIGFSCTGKTSLGEKVFGKNILDSDDELLKWIYEKKHEYFKHIYEIYMKLGRDPAISLIKEAEEALITKWAHDTTRKVISLGPGFPLHNNWACLRKISYVILFRSSPQSIYDHMKGRREKTFKCCPEAEKIDNWDIGVMRDNDRMFSKEEAVSHIQNLLCERENKYRDNDAEIVTDCALRKLIELARAFQDGSTEDRIN